jgi:hypothetical protein
MNAIKAFARFWRDFLVGDDMTIAIGAVAAIAGTAILHAIGLPAWWLLPPVIGVTLAVSLRRAIRHRG